MNYTLCDPCAGVGTMLLYAVKKCGYKKENCYGIELDELNVKILQKLGFVNIIQGDASDPKTWEKFGKNMKFDRIIMNPPYSGNLHLKILREAMKHADEVVNLSPNFYEDYKKLDSVPVATDIEVVERDEASKMFGGIQLSFNLAIQHYVKGKEDKALLERFVPETYKIFSTKKFTKSFKDVFIDNYDGHGVFVPLKLMTPCWDKNKDHIVDKLGILVDGKTLDGTYYKNRRNKNVDRPCGGIKFDNLDEAKKFIEMTEDKMFIAWVRAFHTNSRYILSEYPFDFTEVTKQLTQEERGIIENELYTL